MGGCVDKFEVWLQEQGILILTTAGTGFCSADDDELLEIMGTAAGFMDAEAIEHGECGTCGQKTGKGAGGRSKVSAPDPLVLDDE